MIAIDLSKKQALDADPETIQQINFTANLDRTGQTNDGKNFPHKLLLTNTQVSRLHKAFANGSSANIKSSKRNCIKQNNQEDFQVGIYGYYYKPFWPLIGNVLKPLTKSVLIQLGLTAAVSATNAAINKKRFESGNTTLMISNEKVNNIMKIVKSLRETGLLIKDLNETFKNEAKEQKVGFVGMLLNTLGSGLLGNILTG